MIDFPFFTAFNIITLCLFIKYNIKQKSQRKNMKYFLWIRKHFISLCGYKHLRRALVHIRACPLKETGTYTLSSERIKETEGEINIQLLCGAYLLYYSLLRNFCVVFLFLLFKSPCLSICLFPQTISPFSEFTKDDNFGITLSILSTERERERDNTQHGILKCLSCSF